MALNIATVILAAAGIGLNVAVGTAVYLLKLPIYMDSIGIVLTAMLVPGKRSKAFVVAALVAVASFVIGGLLVNPFLPWFIATGIAGAAYGAFVVRGRVDALIAGTASQTTFASKLLLFGVGWGILAALVSAPVVVYLFGGVTGSGTTLILAFLVKTGHQLLSAALLTGLSAEPIDKTLQFLCALLLAKSTPRSFRDHLQSETT
jgi:energy-coupling factor transport system substrate-specific component